VTKIRKMTTMTTMGKYDDDDEVVAPKGKNCPLLIEPHIIIPQGC
jgi:hypothetical protein